MQTPEVQKGCDKYFGFLLDGNGSYREISQESASSWQAADGQLWIHINYTDIGQSAWLTSVPNLDPLVIDALLAEETRPRTTAIGDGLLIVLRGINPNPDANPEDMVSIRIWMDKSLVITTRKRDLISVQNIIHQLKVGGGPKNTSEFLLELLDNLVLRINDTVDYFEDKIAELEELVLSNSGNEIRNDLATLRRQAITIKRYLAPQREAVSRLITEKAEWIDDSVRLNLRETNDRLIRHIEDIDAVRERAAVTQEELQNRLSEQLNTRMYVLSVVAAVFLPLGFLTGLVGVNLAGIPGANYEYAFYVFIVVLFVTVVLQVVVFRLFKWM